MRGSTHRTAFITRAREGYEIAGRGFVLSMDDEDEDRYVTLEELRESLSREPEMLGLLDAVQAVHDTYDPQREALVLVSREEAIQVLLVHRGGLTALGQVEFRATM